MEILESAMAFAVVMIILSTITTGITELMLRLIGTRERTLKRSMNALCRKVLLPRLKDRLVKENRPLGSHTSSETQLASQFADEMTSNPVIEKSLDSRRWQVRYLLSILPAGDASKVSELTPLAFAERLARTEVGRAIYAEGKEQVDLLITDFVRSFERFGKAATEVYRKKAQIWSTCIGIILALAVNIDAGRLFSALMDNPDIRAGLIEEAEEAYQANQAAEQRLRAVENQLAQQGLDSEQAEAEIRILREELGEAIDRVTSGQDKRLTGLPIGHVYYPYCSSDGREIPRDKACQETLSDYDRLLEFLQWFLLCVISGILIGLGGPFWFGVFNSLSQVFQTLGALGIGKKKSKSDDDDESESKNQVPVVGSAQPIDVIDAFRVAAEVHTRSAPTNVRLLLGPGGESL